VCQFNNALTIDKQPIKMVNASTWVNDSISSKQGVEKTKHLILTYLVQFIQKTLVLKAITDAIKGASSEFYKISWTNCIKV